MLYSHTIHTSMYVILTINHGRAAHRTPKSDCHNFLKSLLWTSTNAVYAGPLLPAASVLAAERKDNLLEQNRNPTNTRYSSTVCCTVKWAMNSWHWLYFHRQSDTAIKLHVECHLPRRAYLTSYMTPACQNLFQTKHTITSFICQRIESRWAMAKTDQ